MSSIETGPIRDVLRTAVRYAMKERDRQALCVYRSALAAIDNAEAVPPSPEHRAGAIEASAAGPGRADVARRELTEQDMRAVVQSEIDERCAAAQSLAGVQPAAERQLRDEATLLQGLLDGGGPNHSGGDAPTHRPELS